MGITKTGDEIKTLHLIFLRRASILNSLERDFSRGPSEPRGEAPGPEQAPHHPEEGMGGEAPRKRPEPQVQL